MGRTSPPIKAPAKLNGRNKSGRRVLSPRMPFCVNTGASQSHSSDDDAAGGNLVLDKESQILDRELG